MTERRPTLDDLAWPMRTARLELRRGRPGDAQAVFAYRRREDVARWLGRVQTDERYWTQQWAERVDTAIIVEHDGQVIGDTRLVVRDANAQAEVMDAARRVEAELMWAFDPAWHGQGYATEAIGELIRIGFDELHLRRLTAVCYADNERSWRLMERVGMRRESRSVRSALHRSGIWQDFLTYAVLAPSE